MDDNHVCGFVRNSGQRCRRSVRGEGSLCWQHASGLWNRYGSLSRNQRVNFFLTLLFGVITAIGTVVGILPFLRENDSDPLFREPLIRRFAIEVAIDPVTPDIRLGSSLS